MRCTALVLGLFLFACSFSNAAIIMIEPDPALLCGNENWVATNNNAMWIIKGLHTEGVVTDFSFAFEVSSPEGGQILTIYNFVADDGIDVSIEQVHSGGRHYVLLTGRLGVRPDTIHLAYIEAGRIQNGDSLKHFVLECSDFRPWTTNPPLSLTCAPSSHTYQAYMRPICGPPIIAPTSIEGIACSLMSYDFNLGTLCWNTEPDDPPNPNVRFQKISGPGNVDSITGLWEYQPTADEAGIPQVLVLRPFFDYCLNGIFSPGISQSVQILVTGNLAAPIFAASQSPHFVASSGTPLHVILQVTDSDDCQNHRFQWYSSAPNPWPSGQISMDSLTGELTYFGLTADTGTWRLNCVVSEGAASDTMGIYIHHFDGGMCGDVDHSNAIDISDLSWLLDYLFFNQTPPIGGNTGDMNGDSSCDLSDAQRLIDYLFFNAQPLCEP